MFAENWNAAMEVSNYLVREIMMVQQLLRLSTRFKLGCFRSLYFSQSYKQFM